MTCGESCHEDVDVYVVGLVVFPICVHDFETFLVTDSDLMDVEELVGDVCEEIAGIVDCFRGGFVKVFVEFSPEAVEHEFGGGFASGIFDDESWIEIEFFFLLVSSDVIRFGFRGVDSAGVPCGFLLDFESGVDVIGKEPCFSLLTWEIPDFVDLDYSVSHFDGFDELGGAPGPAQLSLFGSMRTIVRLFQEAFWHFFFDATLAEEDGELTARSVR